MSFMFFHNGIVMRDSEDDRAFIALNISMTTSIESDIVDAVRVVRADGAKMEQSVVANWGESVEHEWKCDYSMSVTIFYSKK